MRKLGMLCRAIPQVRTKVYMNIAVLSDIHGNYVALQECINYAMNNKISKKIEKDIELICIYEF